MGRSLSLSSRSISVLAVAALGFTVAMPRAHAVSPSSMACANAAEEGQKARDEGHLFVARERFAQCLRPECPGVIAKECAAWLEDVNARFPDLVIAVVDGDGRDVSDASVEVDGVRSPDAASGRALSLDPGTHTLRVAKGAFVTEERVVLRERERGRRVVLRLGPKPKVETPETPETRRGTKPGGERIVERPVPTLTWVLAGVGGVLAAAGTGFGLSAASSYSDLEKRCPNDCTDSDILGLRAKTVTSDIAFSLALAAGIGAAVVYFIRPTVVREPVVAGVAGFRF